MRDRRFARRRGLIFGYMEYITHHISFGMDDRRGEDLLLRETP